MTHTLAYVQGMSYAYAGSPCICPIAGARAEADFKKGWDAWHERKKPAFPADDNESELLWCFAERSWQVLFLYGYTTAGLFGLDAARLAEFMLAKRLAGRINESDTDILLAVSRAALGN